MRVATRPRYLKYKAMLGWHGGSYDPDDIGEAEIVAAPGKLARRRPLGPAYLKSVQRQS